MDVQMLQTHSQIQAKVVLGSEPSQHAFGFNGDQDNAQNRQRTYALCRVLLIESLPGNRNFVSLLLDRMRTRLRFQLVVLDNGIDASEWLFSQPNAFDLILFDPDLPDISGLEFCRWIRALPDMQDIPLVALTSIHREATVEKWQAMDINGFFDPFASPAEMRSLLRQWLMQSPFRKKKKRITSRSADN